MEQLTTLIGVLKSYTLPLGNGQVTLWMAAVGLVTILLSLFAVHLVCNYLERLLLGLKSVEMNLHVVLARSIRILLMTVVAVIVFQSLGFDLTILSVFGGALGVGLGFGMQKIASNYISGFIMLFERSVRLGDRIAVGDFQGTITKIATRYCVIKNDAGEELLVPNETFITTAIRRLAGAPKSNE